MDRDVELVYGSLINLYITVSAEFHLLVDVALIIGILCATQPDTEEELLSVLLGAMKLLIRQPLSALISVPNRMDISGTTFMIDINYRQQAPLHLGFYSFSIKGWIT